ncbi:hypothetical protein BDP27DRAFT_1378630 [Rhodocollybia butyracea]|uniref:Uncharacterized protein n=1 Tax=Rhodocollybia butyracea TaxID=206335 RepID=A0A9P5TVK4_9AGAR|nr:hypothetical protein BDP27DRAFT_1378630 [Rhodocollybia butyracea]
MPKAVHAWVKSLSILASRKVAPPRDSVADGEHIVATLFKSWLRIRDSVLSRLHTPQVAPIKLSNKCWRSLLDVVGGLHTGSALETRSGMRHADMRDVLENTLRIDKGGSFMDAPVYWEGKLIGSDGLPDASVARAVLWELCELNFRHELEALDGVLDESKMAWTDRNTLVNQCWVGLVNQVNIAEATQGLGATSVVDRAPFLQMLHKVMRTWEGVKPAELVEAFPDTTSAHNYSTRLERVELNLALFYCESFLNVYGRAASVPHHL